MSPRIFYRTIAIAEAVTWTLLIAGMLMKYVFKVGDWPVSVGGFAHGLVFIAYVTTAVLVGLNQRWPTKLIVGAAATAFVPYLTIPFDNRLEKQAKLDGGWRTAATSHPRDPALDAQPPCASKCAIYRVCWRHHGHHAFRGSARRPGLTLHARGS